MDIRAALAAAFAQGAPGAPSTSADDALADVLCAAEERAAIREHDGGADREEAEAAAWEEHAPAILAAIRAGTRASGAIASTAQAAMAGKPFPGTVTYRLIERLVAEGRLRRAGRLGGADLAEGRGMIGRLRAPSRTRPRTRPRGFAPWRPPPRTAALLAEVRAVLAEYHALLPLTVRQVFYRLVSTCGFEKPEAAYARLGETMNRARRAGLIPWEAIRDDGVTRLAVTSWPDAGAFRQDVAAWARGFRLDRQEGQARAPVGAVRGRRHGADAGAGGRTLRGASALLGGLRQRDRQTQPRRRAGALGGAAGGAAPGRPRPFGRAPVRLAGRGRGAPWPRRWVAGRCASHASP